MREKDLFVLEFDKIRHALKEHCLSEPAERECLNLIPGRDPDKINSELEEVEEWLCLLQRGIQIPLETFPDFRSWMREAEAEDSLLEGTRLVAILAVLKMAERLRSSFTGLTQEYGSLKRLRPSLYRIPSLEAALGKAVEENGELKSTASPKLYSIRRRTSDIRGQLLDRLNRLLRSRELTSLLSGPVVTLRNNRYVVPIPTEVLDHIPGVVQDRSASGRTCYVEPLFAVDLNNKLLLSKTDEREEEIRVLKELTTLVLEKGRELDEIFSTLLRIDLLQAKSKLAQRLNAVRPTMGGADIILKKARHPLLVMSQADVTPIDILIPKDKRGLILTGPNMGGKTVALKTLGLLAIMAQSGFLIPAEAGACLPVFHGVYTDMGNEESLDQSLSTFSARLLNLREIYHELAIPALVILDELGAGPDPTEGSALGREILRAFLSKGCHLFVATQLRSIKLLGLTEENLQVASVEFDLHSFAPLFRLIYRSIGESMALKIARRLNFPEEILIHAEQGLSQDDREIGPVLWEKEIGAAVEKPKRERIPIHAESESSPTEFDLRGLKVQDAIQEAQRYLDRAIRSRHDRVKLIHGLGSGALKNAVQSYLASSPYCASFHPGEQHEGGAGVTLVELMHGNLRGP
jgi:DNA mismatch repair protein MutS2